MHKPIGSHRPISGGSTVSIVGGDTAIVGNVKAVTDLHIDGRVEGDISCNSLVQGESSEVVGSIAAETVRIAGRVDGSITAREVVILKSARIRGDIVYDTLTIEQGAQLDGCISPRGNHGPQPIVRSGESESRLILGPHKVDEAR